jgi:RNA polymerase sigma factor (sigma-70 family)
MKAEQPPDEDTLYREVRKKAYAVGRTKTSDSDELKDLGAKAEAAVFFERLKNPNALGTRDARERFTNKVVRNTDIDSGRRKSTRTKKKDEIVRAMDDNPSHVSDPEMDAEASRRRGLVYAAVSKLKPYFELIVHLRWLDGGMSTGEIADALGKSPGTISTDLFNAKAELRKDPTLSAYFDQWEPD